MSIEEAKKRLTTIITTKFNNDYSIDSTDKEAIEKVLNELEKQNKIIEELWERYGDDVIATSIYESICENLLDKE